MKRNTQKQIRRKKYSADIHEEVLVNYIFKTTKVLKILIIFTHYVNFIQKVMQVIDLTTPIKSRQIKQNIQEWFNGEKAKKISALNKLFKKFKQSKLHINKEIESAKIDLV